MVGPLILLGTLALCACLSLCWELRREARALYGLLRRRGGIGGPHTCGYCKPLAFTSTSRVTGTNAGPSTVAVSSLRMPPGGRSQGEGEQPTPAPSSKPTGPFSPGGATAEPGASLAALESVA